MKKTQKEKIDDYQVTLIHKAFAAYGNVLRTLQDGFTLGEFARAARKKFSMRDPIGKEIHQALMKNKNEVVVLA